MPLAALVLLAAVLRLHGLDAHGLWFDEMLSVHSACGSVLEEPIAGGATFSPTDFWHGNSLPRVAEAVVRQDGGNGILYHLLLHAWLRLAGTGDLAARLPSVVAGILTVAWTHVLARRLTTPRVAVWAGLLAATHPLLVRMSQEARPYAWATALAVLSTVLLVSLVDARARVAGRLFAYALTAAALVLTHYLAAAVLIVHAAFAALGPVPPRRRVPVLAALAVAALSASVWMPLGGARGMAVMGARDRLYRERARTRGAEDPFAAPVTPRTVGAGLVQQAAAVTGNGLQNWGIRLSWLWPLLALPGLLIAAGYGKAEGWTPGARRLLSPLAVASLSTSLALAARAGHVISFQPRYGSFVAAFAAILLAGGVAGGGPIVRAAALGQAAVMLASLLGVYADAPAFRPRNPYPMRAAALRATTGTIVHASWSEARMVNLYLPPGPTPSQQVRGAGETR